MTKEERIKGSIIIYSIYTDFRSRESDRKLETSGCSSYKKKTKAIHDFFSRRVSDSFPDGAFVLSML